MSKSKHMRYFEDTYGTLGQVVVKHGFDTHQWKCKEDHKIERYYKFREGYVAALRLVQKKFNENEDDIKQWIDIELDAKWFEGE